MAKVSGSIDRSKLWELNILDLLTSEGVLNTVLVYNKEKLDLRTQLQHRHLKLEHLRLKKDKDGRKYVSFNNPRILGRVQQSRLKPVRYYEHLEDNDGKNSPSYFEVLQTYYNYLPERRGPFYRCPVPVSRATSKPEFTKIGMSAIALGEMLTSIYRRAEERSDAKNYNQTKSVIDMTETIKQDIYFTPPRKRRFENPVIIPLIELDEDEEPETLQSPVEENARQSPDEASENAPSPSDEEFENDFPSPDGEFENTTPSRDEEFENAFPSRDEEFKNASPSPEKESKNIQLTSDKTGEKDRFATTPLNAAFSKIVNTTSSRESSNAQIDTTFFSSGLCYKFGVENASMCLQVSGDVPVLYRFSSEDGGKRLQFCFQTT